MPTLALSIRSRSAKIWLLILAFLGSARAEKPPESSKQDALRQTKTEEPPSPGLDTYGDPLPPGAVARLGTMRLRHHAFGLNSSLMFTSDGKGLLTTSSSDPPRLWNVDDGKLLRQYGDAWQTVGYAVMSPDARFLAWRNCRNSNLQILETATGKLVREFAGDWHTDGALACAFSPNGKWIGACVKEQFGVWEIATGRRLWVQAAGTIRAIAFSPDGKTVASGNARTDTVVVRDARTGDEVCKLGHSEKEKNDLTIPISPLAFSPNGDALLVNSSNGGRCSLCLWDLKSGKPRWRIVEPMQEGVASATFSSDGKMVAAKTNSGYIAIWETNARREVRRWYQCQGLSPIAWSPRGHILASMINQVVHFWDVETGRELSRPKFQAHEGPISSAEFLPDGESLVSAEEDGAVRIWNTRTGREQRHLLPNQPLWPSNWGRRIYLSLSHDGKVIAINLPGVNLEEKTILNGRTPRGIRLLNVATSQETHRLNTKRVVVLDKLTFSPTGKRLAASVWDQSEEVLLWDLADGKKIEQRILGSRPAFSPDGAILVTRQNHHRKPNAKIDFWEIATGKKLHNIDFVSDVVDLALSSDGNSLVALSRSRDGAPTKIILFPLSWGSAPSQVCVGPPRQISCALPSSKHPIVFSSDDRLLAFGDRHSGNVYVWEVASGKERSRFSGHVDFPKILRFCVDKRRLVSGSRDSTLLVWDLTGRIQEDGGLRPTRRAKNELAGLWEKLGDDDAVSAGRAVWELASAEAPAVGLLDRHLQPVPPASPQEMELLIGNLDAAAFAVRRQARTALAKLGERCEPALRRALACKPSLEARRSLHDLLSSLEAARQAPPNEILQRLRAVEVLEHIGTPEARRVLEKLSAGATGARLTQEAQTAVHRLDQAQSRQKERAVPAEKFRSE